MRKEVYPALYRCDGVRAIRMDAETGTPLDACEPYQVAIPVQAAEAWARVLPDDATIALAGNGLSKYADVFTAELGKRGVLVPEELWHPTGSSLLMAAWAARFAWGEADPSVLLPVYTRLSDAEEAEAARHAVAHTLPDNGVAGPEARR